MKTHRALELTRDVPPGRRELRLIQVLAKMALCVLRPGDGVDTTKDDAASGSRPETAS
jgi:hypothetical protein